mmetsp:Transcript_17933/g.2922  ORF Transcript_17933/g.2922 Transcript_17933/m.2922 type:complete len:86 (+) Transcript_17933:282-539(+)
MWTAGVVYLVFSSFTMFLMLVWIFILIASVWDKNCNGVGLIVAIVSWVFYLIGVLVWFLLTKAQFDEDECDEYDMDNGNPAPICA